MFRTIFLFVFLITAAVSDIRRRHIPALLLLISGTAGVFMYVLEGGWSSRSVTDTLFGLIIGGVFIGLSLISEGKLGMGDALAILVTGIYLGGSAAAFAVLSALMISAVVSAGILLLKKGSGKSAIPFMPFLLAGCIIQSFL